MKQAPFVAQKGKRPFFYLVETENERGSFYSSHHNSFDFQIPLKEEILHLHELNDPWLWLKVQFFI